MHRSGVVEDLPLLLLRKRGSKAIKSGGSSVKPLNRLQSEWEGEAGNTQEPRYNESFRRG